VAKGKSFNYALKSFNTNCKPLILAGLLLISYNISLYEQYRRLNAYKYLFLNALYLF